MRVALPDRIVLAALLTAVTVAVALRLHETASLQARHDVGRAGGRDPAPPAVSGATEPTSPPNRPTARPGRPHGR